MGNYRSRRPGFLQAWQIAVAEYTFQGISDEEIIERLWNWSAMKKTIPDEAKQKRKHSDLKRKLTNCKKDPKFVEYYKSILTEWSVHNVGKALNKLSEQIDSKEPWLANKAANDVLARGMKLFDGEDANTMTVRIEGMPELGTPETEE